MSSKSTKSTTKIIHSIYNRPQFNGITFNNPSLTKQQFHEESTIDYILKKYQNTQILTHVNNQTPQFGDFTNLPSYEESLQTVIHAQNQFELLPALVRDRFANDPTKLLTFLQDPQNQEEAVRLGLASPKPITDEPPPLKHGNTAKPDSNQPKGGSPPPGDA